LKHLTKKNLKFFKTDDKKNLKFFNLKHESEKYSISNGVQDLDFYFTQIKDSKTKIGYSVGELGFFATVFLCL